MKTVLKFPGSSKIWHGSGALPAEIPTTAKPNHHLSPSFPRNPLSPPSDPVQRRLQSPSAKSNFLAVEEETPRYGLARDFESTNPIHVWFSELPSLFRDIRGASSLRELWVVLFGKPGEEFAASKQMQAEK